MLNNRKDMLSGKQIQKKLYTVLFIAHETETLDQCSTLNSLYL